jgi:hypothetical protein
VTGDALLKGNQNFKSHVTGWCEDYLLSTPMRKKPAAKLSGWLKKGVRKPNVKSLGTGIIAVGGVVFDQIAQTGTTAHIELVKDNKHIYTELQTLAWFAGGIDATYVQTAQSKVAAFRHCLCGSINIVDDGSGVPKVRRWNGTADLPKYENGTLISGLPRLQTLIKIWETL